MDETSVLSNETGTTGGEQSSEVFQPSTLGVDGQQTQVAETEEQRAARERTTNAKTAAENNRLAAERRIADDRDQWRDAFNRVASLMERGERPAKADVATAQAEAMPKPDDFADYSDFVAAKAAFVSRQQTLAAVNGMLTSALQNHQKTLQQGEEERVISSHLDRAAQYARDNPDFHEVTNRADLIVPDAARDAIVRSPMGPAILHELALQPEILPQLKRMPALEQVFYIGQMSQYLMHSKQPAALSSAAPAGKTVGARPAPSGGPPKDTAAYMAWADAKYKD